MIEAPVVSNEPCGTQLRLITLEVVLAEHEHPGQFVTAHLEGRKPAYFAIASSPGERMELLVKQEGETAEAICLLKPGDTLEITPPIGKGFPLDQVEDLPLVLLCNGSGISACRPVIRAEIAAGLPRPVHFYYGVLSPDRRSFLNELEVWGNAGVKVHTVVAPPGAPGWRGAVGLVQDVAGEHGLVRPDVGVVLVGMPAMIEQARKLYREAGAPDEHLLVNF